jgi:hypothetical protein
MVATITEAGWEEVAEPEVAQRFSALLEHKRAQGQGEVPKPPAPPSGRKARTTP